jgi:hypothetical protein
MNLPRRLWILLWSGAFGLLVITNGGTPAAMAVSIIVGALLAVSLWNFSLHPTDPGPSRWRSRQLPWRRPSLSASIAGELLALLRKEMGDVNGRYRHAAPECRLDNAWADLPSSWKCRSPSANRELWE